MVPSNRYIKTLIEPHRFPKKRPAERTKKLEREIGTGPTGIFRYAPMIIRAVKSDERAIIFISGGPDVL